ncbi:MAG: glycosyltransferase [Candidatus Zixiibacteriota bacterium]
MPRIKILYIIDYLSAGGGTERQMRQLVLHLDREQFDPTLVTLRPIKWLNMPEHVNPNCEHICLDVPRLAGPKAALALFRLARFLRRHRFDIVHTFFQDANLMGVLAGTLAGTRSIIVSRRDIGHWYTPGKLFVLRQFNRMADYFLVNSDAVKRSVAGHERFRPERIKVVRNGYFDLPDDSPSPLSKTELGVPADSPLVGVVANLGVVKRIDNFIRVAGRVADKKCHFVVIGASDNVEPFYDLARQCGLEGRFHILHTLENIFNHVKLFDVGVLTSDAEGLSNTLIEYQLCGKPALAFDVGGNREALRDGRTGYLIPPGDLDGMVKGLDALLTDHGLRKSMGANAAAWARQEFAGQRLIEQTSAFYRHSLTGKDITD